MYTAETPGYIGMHTVFYTLFLYKNNFIRISSLKIPKIKNKLRTNSGVKFKNTEPRPTFTGSYKLAAEPVNLRRALKSDTFLRLECSWNLLIFLLNFIGETFWGWMAGFVLNLFLICEKTFFETIFSRCHAIKNKQNKQFIQRVAKRELQANFVLLGLWEREEKGKRRGERGRGKRKSEFF